MAYKRFPAKVLLFGEHILLRGATALSLPVPRFGGHWAWISPEKAVPAQGLLRELARSEMLREVPGLDAEAFALELSRGIWFRSDMMSGYGLGSSGVVCAAIYDRYCREKTSDLTELKSQLAHIESFFHGKSSGIDPLTSYLGQPIVVRNRTAVSVADCPDWSGQMRIFLLDSRQARPAGSLIHRFQDMCHHPEFATELDYFLADAHEPAVRQFLAADFDGFWESMAQVSEFQYTFMRYMIPRDLHYRWERGLGTGDFYLKICGAGGGGFMLLFVKNPAVAEVLGRLHRLTEISPILKNQVIG